MLYCKTTIAVMILLIILPLSVFSWDRKDSGGFTQPGRRVSSSINLSGDSISYSYRTFKIRVPENVFKMEVKIENSPTDLDIYMNHEREIDDYDYTDYSSTEDLFNEDLTISRLTSNPLYSGIYYIDVVYPLDVLPIFENREISVIPFIFTVTFTTLGNAHLLEADEVVHSTLSGQGNMMELFAVDVAATDEPLRIDLFDTKSDLDLYVRYESQAMTAEEADYIRESYLGRESLVIDRQSVKPLRPGRYYISVFDRIADSFSDDFSLVTSRSDQAPDFLLEYPVLPRWSSLFDEALYATVEIATENGSGSGCLVSPHGYILTGLHVITDISGEVSDELYISMNLSSYYPPQEIFKAELIDIRKDEDLALIKISSGLYGQNPPEDYHFPYFRMAVDDPVVMGQELRFLGYPQIGSEGSRASITLTRGIVSGFDTMDFGYLIKTDGEINSGNSGGAAFNEDCELIGLPMSVISSDGGQMAYIHPLSLVPEEWVKLINSRDNE